MARSHLTDLLRRIHAAHADRSVRGVPADEIYEEQSQRRSLSRAQFLGAAAAFGGAFAVDRAAWPLSALAKSAPRVVIVGGGLAGVSCAYRLRQKGVAPALYDANANVGGRTWTLRDFWNDGPISEHGGGFISSEHNAGAGMAREMGLELVDLRGAEKPNTAEVYWVHGRRIAFKEMLHEYGKVFPKIKAANDAADYPTLYNRYNHAGYVLDHMSVRDWVQANVPGGIHSTIGWMLAIDATGQKRG